MDGNTGCMGSFKGAAAPQCGRGYNFKGVISCKMNFAYSLNRFWQLESLYCIKALGENDMNTVPTGVWPMF